ncbi:rhodanese-like domain-containing protein [Moraxella sp. Tifton1]|uniref:Rhodanese-like domain-containing protein n=1 Tax=Moraxella oculi TaxID=2940516 RepID=A0ABW8U8P3_9GAMM|nr:rhodanese-like domain-containing protein [Moraxella sp. Tifton1]MCL1622938.1 rhodanese-like domain-containing protein [Moraxella sp. Tifton1]
MISQMDIKDLTPSAEQNIWDVRDEKSYREGHIEYAKNIPLSTINQSLLQTVKGDIYVLCGGGTKAGRACAMLDELDPDRRIIHLTGGTRGAKALGMTIISEQE